MDPVLLPALVIGGLTLVGGFVGASIYAEKKRREAIRALAEPMGFTFAADAAELLTRFSGLPLFTSGRSRQVTNCLSGRAGNAEICAFDYRYTTGSGKNSTTWRQTVVAIAAGRKLPRFRLAPESIFHKLGELMGYKDIDFKEMPKFSKEFLLRGDDEDAVRQAFSFLVMQFFEDHLGASAESDGRYLTLFRLGRRAKPEELAARLKDCEELALLFARG